MAMSGGDGVGNGTHGRDPSALISVIAPLQNDSAIIEEFVSDLNRCLGPRFENFEILLVDDGSKDDTLRVVDKVLKNFEGIRYLRLSRRFGLETAIAAGMESAIGDYVVVMLPGCDPVGRLPEMIELVRTSESGLVIGKNDTISKDSSILHRLAYRGFYSLCNSVLDLNLIPNTTYFVALDRGLLNSINQIKDKFRYLKSLTTFVGSKPVLFPYEYAVRHGKEWRRGFIESVNLGIDLVVANSVRPLRLVSLLGVTVSGINFLYFGYIALIALFKRNVAEGWITLSTQMALAFFVLNIVLAVLCEYIGRILLESKERPSYFVAEERNSSVLIVDREKRRNVVGSTVQVTTVQVNSQGRLTVRTG
jgi:glycosyltransferase involved in cell wall biosynthesis